MQFRLPTPFALLFFALPASGDELRTGEYELTAPVSELLAQANIELDVEGDATWSLYVPDGIRPDDPPGVLVYISPSSSGEVPRNWKRVLAQMNLIFVAASDSGNDVATARRALLATVAPQLVARHYPINPERVYLSGLSGGARVASILAVDQAPIFDGGIFNCGAEFWDAQEPEHLELLHDRRYVFVTGSEDHARRSVHNTYRRYLEAGLDNVMLLDVRLMGHTNPDRYRFAEAIRYLDGRLEDR